MSTGMARKRAGKARARLHGRWACGRAEIAKPEATIVANRKEMGYGG